MKSIFFPFFCFVFVFILAMGSSPVNIYLFKVNKSTLETVETEKKGVKYVQSSLCRHQNSGVFHVNFKYILHIYLVFLWSTLNR